jgi:RNA polymerase sigma factor (sigma-70 family)
LIRDRETDIARLLERCKRGDETAWATIVDKFSNLVYSVPARMKLNAEDCADVFQATFLALNRGIDRIENAVALPKWLAVTASREALRLKRNSKNYATSAEVEALDLEAVVENEEASAEAMMFQAVEAEAVRTAVAKLPAKCKELISALFLEGDVPYSDVSERTGVPMGGIGPTRARCLDKLRQILTHSGFFDE